MVAEYYSLDDALRQLGLTFEKLGRLVADGELRGFLGVGQGIDMMKFKAEEVDRLRTKLSIDHEELYASEAIDEGVRVVLTEVSEECKRYLARHPEKLYALTPRKFEALVAEIMRDCGLSVELTPETRDGGRDLYAVFKNQITSFLMFVECKRWAPDRHVGIDVVQRLHGVTQAHGANKSMIVTTSFFTRPAQQEQSVIQTSMDLRDYEDLKSWLSQYR